MVRTETELSEYLAKAAGFTNWSEDGIAISADNKVTHDLIFTKSLDACVKWLGPMFPFWEMTKHRSKPGEGQSRIVYSISVDTPKLQYFSEQDSPALAFCRAAEMALDAGGGKDAPCPAK